MHTQRNQGESAEFARIDRAALGLLVRPEHQRPWAVVEIVRALGCLGDVEAGLERLHRVGLVHRWNGMVSASHAAVRFSDTTLSDDPGSAYERRREDAVLEVLLATNTDTGLPMSELELFGALDAKRTKQKLDVTDALARLDGAGLVDRRGDLAFATPAAVRFDQIMDT